MFFSLLNAKMTELGGLVFAVPPQNTSRTCPVCGCVSKENRRTQAKFRCTSCGYEDNADAVAADQHSRARAAPQSLWGARSCERSSSESTFP